MSEVDTSKDDHLSETDALEQAKANGIEFVDFYTFEGASKEYETREDAEKDADGKLVHEARRQKSEGEK